MDLEQLAKRLDWLDEERRKDRIIIQTLEERLAVMEENMPGLLQQVKELNSEVTRLVTMMSKFDQIDASMAQLRVDLSRGLEAQEKARIEREREL